MSDAQAFTRWGRSASAAYLLRDFFTFAKETGVCPDITHEEYDEPCAFIESLLPSRKRGAAAERKYGLYLQPRLTYKTSLVQAEFLYLICRDLFELGRIDVTTVLGRANGRLAQMSLLGIKTHLESNPILRAAFGNLRERFSVWSDEQIIARDRSAGQREPTIVTTSLDSSQTGQHPDFAALDDLVNETNYESSIVMEQARTLVSAYYPIIERWGSLMLVGTRWGDNDVYGWVLKKDEEYAHDHNGQGRWRKLILSAYTDAGRPRFPSVLPESRIAELRSAPGMTEKLFSCWILNEAHAESERIFAASKLQYVDAEYIGGPFGELELQPTDTNAPWIARFGARIPLASIMLLDPAPTVGPKSDFTGLNIVGFDLFRNWWALESRAIKVLPEERLQIVLDLAARYQVRLIAVENADMQAILLQDRLRDQGLQVRVVSFNPKLDRRRMTADPKLAPHGHNSKASQIESVQPVLEAGRIFLVRGKTEPLVRQMIEYPHLDHDDVIDAFSMTKAYETRPEVRSVADPDRESLRIEAEAYAAVGLRFDGSRVNEPAVRRAGPAGLLGPRSA